MAKTIAIIGAGGAMGKWFSEYFSKKGFEVTGFDNTNPVAKNIKKAESLISAILNVDYVLLSTPTKKTPEIIRLIAKEMKRESFLIDITSKKSKKLPCRRKSLPVALSVVMKTLAFCCKTLPATLLQKTCRPCKWWKDSRKSTRKP